MNVFETIKAVVAVPQAAERYGLQTDRSGVCRCPFHEDRHPSLKLNEDYFYCFGCGAKGDVIDFVAQLFGLSSFEAARKLAWDFGIDPSKPPAAMSVKPESKEARCQRLLHEYLKLLTGWKIRYAPSAPEENVDDRFVEACQMIDQVEYLSKALTQENATIRENAVERLCRDGLMEWLERRMTRMKKEVDNHEKSEAA